jgi:TruD family tRNA pseudouridine synthase
MKYSFSPETFFVTEVFKPKLEQRGKYYYYILEKKGVSQKQAVKKIPAQAFFSGIKDKHATTKQIFCTKEKVDDINEENFKTRFIGESNEKIHVGIHKGNIFTIVVELNEEEQKSMNHFKAKNEAVCNYFGEQRFGEKNIEIIKMLEENHFEEALKLFLTKGTKMDSELSTKMREVTKENWGNWKAICENEVIKGTRKEKVFGYLSQNPTSFREAFSYCEPISVKILVKAAQAYRFNEELNKLALIKKPKNIFGEYYGKKHALSASKAFKRTIEIKPNEFEQNYRKTSLERKTFFYAERFKTKRIDKNKFELNFYLDKGCYATVFLIFLNNWLKIYQKESI